ncbi:MAG TPA: adenylyltransferase/cytidyltransferase family protein [Candidatus Limnocylindrales bacterium]|nr:adenylyltransferase/cytidyltransferase family protein [Candidatus Limnocylindrales bacterium]
MNETRSETERVYAVPSMALLESFTLPPDSWSPTQEPSSVIEAGEQYKFKTALVIGRFQPLHWGHIYLIHKALEMSKSVVIGIGSSNTADEKNPFPALQRHLLLERTLNREGIRSRINNIVHLTDHDDDNQWLQRTVYRTGEVEAVVGNNQWVNGIFENAGFQTVEIPMYKRQIYKGEEIRRNLRSAGLLRPH